MATDLNTDRLSQALELLRSVRNNVMREEFHQMVISLCVEDGNVRYPLIEAGQAAMETHRSAIRNLKDAEAIQKA